MTSSAESEELKLFRRWAVPDGPTRSITRSPRQVWEMSTPTRRLAGAFPLLPETVMVEVTAGPLSGMATGVLLSYVVPPPPPPSERDPTATAAQASCTALY